MELKPGDKVRLFSSKKTSVVIGPSYPSDLDGTERWEVRVDDTGATARIHPDMVMPVDQPLEDDPPYVLLSPSYEGKKTWAIKDSAGNGFRRVQTPLDVEVPPLDPPEMVIEPVDIKSGIWMIRPK